jgi:hypothetical protein
MQALRLDVPKMTTIHSGHPADTLKMIRETLCVAQSAIVSHYGRPTAQSDVDRIQRLIDDIDKQRPLGPDGKHGDLHTEWCQCKDR